MTKDKLYKSALDLYGTKESLEQHLSSRTNELFDLEDKIILYDLTNTYFEGRKTNIKLAQFGRSKEKRSDCKLVVLTLVVNVEGFIKYSNIFEGNMSDSKSLPEIIEEIRYGLAAKTSDCCPRCGHRHRRKLCVDQDERLRLCLSEPFQNKELQSRRKGQDNRNKNQGQTKSKPSESVVKKAYRLHRQSKKRRKRAQREIDEAEIRR